MKRFTDTPLKLLAHLRTMLLLILLATAVGLSGCGGSSSDDSGGGDSDDGNGDGGDDNGDPPATFDISVVVEGLRDDGQVTLALGEQSLVVEEANTAVTFPEALDDGASYQVEITEQPAEQACSSDNGEGTVDGDDVLVVVHCRDQVAIDAAIVNHAQVTLDWSVDDSFDAPDRFDLAWNSLDSDESGLAEDVTAPFTVDELGMGENWRFTVTARYDDSSVDTSVARRISGLGFGGSILASHPAPQGGIYVGGDFSFAGQISGASARLDLRDGQLMPMPEIVGDVLDSWVDDNGHIYLAGDMRVAGSQRYLLRLSPEGDVDTDWEPVLDGPVHSLAWFDDSLVIGGEFSQVEGDGSHAHLTLLDAEGRPRADWSGLETGGKVSTLAVFDNRLVAGGEFQNPNTGDYLAAWTEGGELVDTPLPNAAVTALLAMEERLYLGGLFQRIDGEDRSFIAALDADLELGDWSIGMRGPDDEDYDGLPPIASVRALAEHQGHLILGGAFGAVDDEPRRNLAALDADGNLMDWRPEPDNQVDALLPLGDDILVGGRFRDIARLDRAVDSDRYQLSRLARLSFEPLDEAGRPVVRESFVLGADAAVQNLNLAGDSVIAGGQFSTIGYWLEGASGLARLKEDGALDTNAEHLIAGGGVRDMQAHDNWLYLVGDFQYFFHPDLAGSAPVSFAVRLGPDGAPDSGWRMARPEPGMVDQAVFHNGQLIIGGDFSEFLGQGAVDRLAAMDSNGSVDLSWRSGDGPDDRVRDLAVLDGTVFAGGPFMNVREAGADETRRGLAAFDGDSGALDDWAPGTEDQSGRLVRHGDQLAIGLDQGSEWEIATLDDPAQARDPRASLDGEIKRLRSNEAGLFAFGDFATVSVDGAEAVERPGVALFSTAEGDFSLTDFNPGTLRRNGEAAAAIHTAFQWNDRICLGGDLLRVENHARGGLACFDASGQLTP